MTYEQERREALDNEFFAVSESQNCLQEARQVTSSLDESGKINQILANNKFVVFFEVMNFCNSTDAFAGSYKRFDKDFDTYDEADQYIAENHADCDCDQIRIGIAKPDWAIKLDKMAKLQEEQFENDAETDYDDVPF